VEAPATRTWRRCDRHRIGSRDRETLSGFESRRRHAMINRTRKGTKMTETKMIVTSGLRRHDVVEVMGMRVLLMHPLSDDGETVSWSGKVTNVAEAVALGIPASFIRDGQWTVQGTDARVWPVIRTAH